MKQIKQNKQGIVSSKVFDDYNEGIILSIICETDKTAVSSLFRTLVFHITSLCTIYHPKRIGDILTITLDNFYKKIYPNCDTIEDAINWVKDTQKEEISIEYYKTLTSTIGRNFLKIVGYDTPDKKISALLLLGGKGMAKGSIYDTEQLATIVAKQIVETNPLTTKRCFLTPSIINYIGQQTINTFREKDFISIRNPITKQNELVSTSSERIMKQFITEDINKFIKENVLECQDFYYKPETTINKQFRYSTVEQYLKDVGLWIVGDFIRHSIK